jgi:adenine-specific DNA-methyltransferase
VLPEVRTEGGKIDFERLKAVMGESIDVGKERYGMNWPGKVDSFKTIQMPSLGTLRPCAEESVNFDTTENLIIEGDNLESLKLLQKSYLGKIKMIYIDPPYNTGNDFIYPDNYTESLQTYLEYTGQVDDEGKKFGTNTDSDGRFHSKWMTMIYPRLYLARNLLREDGAIFISIDYRELSNLTQIMNDIFGEENLVGIISVVSNWKGRSDDKFVATANEFLVIYQKGNFQSLGLPLTEEYLSSYTERDANGKAFRLLGLRKRGAGAKRSDRPNMFYLFYADPKTGEVSLEKTGNFTVPVTPKLSDGTDGRWRWGKVTSKENISFLIAKKVSGTERLDVFEKDYAETEDGLRRIKPKSIWIEKDLSNEAGTLEYKELMSKVPSQSYF